MRRNVAKLVGVVLTAALCVTLVPVQTAKAEDVVLLCFELFEQPERLMKMRQALENLQLPNGAKCIVQTMQTLLRENDLNE